MRYELSDYEWAAIKPTLSPAAPKNVAMGYEFRTIFAESGALETIGPRDTGEALEGGKGEPGAWGEMAAVIGRLRVRSKPERLFA
jgi:hypothetical protein